MKKTNTALTCASLAFLSNLNISIDEELSVFDISFNEALANDVEIITVTASYQPINYNARLSSMIQSMNQQNYYGGQNSDQRNEYEEAIQRERAQYCRDLDKEQPIGCDETSVFDLSPNGCSTEFAGFDIPNTEFWDGVFDNSCNSHDECYVDLDQEKGACDTEFRSNMLAQCSAYPGSSTEPYFINECWDKASEYYIGVAVAGGDYFEAAQEDAACDLWARSKRGYC